jgi:hypothetical protein
LAQYERRHGHPLDFTRLYWRPPLSPAAVIASEQQHLERRLDTAALVSITDHDTLEGPKALRAAGCMEVPLSVEWTVRFQSALFHLGVHGIPSSRAEEAERLSAAHTAGAAESLGEVLDWLIECPETFIVLNHPYWDLAQIGGLRHDALLLSFLRAHHHQIHALELNGYRTWSENRRVLPLAEGLGIPIVGGGDRHGRTPNSIVNVTGAASFEEFARDLRAGRRTDCVIFEEYAEPYTWRVLRDLSDYLSRDAEPDGRTWTDRVFVTENGVETPLSALWRSAPLWTSVSVVVTHALASNAFRPVFELSSVDRKVPPHQDLGAHAAFRPMPRLETRPVTPLESSVN